MNPENIKKLLYLGLACIPLLAWSGLALAHSPSETLRIALQSDPRTLDPHLATEAASMRVIEPLYNSLMGYGNEYGTLEKDLVESYSISSDQKKYTFQLKPGIKFHHSGRELRAEDVKYSIERILRKKIRAYQFAHLNKIEITGPYTLTFYLEKPFAPFLTYLAHPMNAIVDSKAVQELNKDLRRQEAGTGAFQLEEWKKNQYLLLKRNEDYFKGGRPFIKRLKFIAIPDETARTLALRTGEVDVLPDVPPKEMPILAKDPAISLSEVPGTFWEYIGLQTKKSPFDNLKVRQAIAWGIDRNELNQMIKRGLARPLTGGPIPEYHWAGGGTSSYPRMDPARAKKLLQEAGYPEGFKAELLVGSDFPYQVDAAQVVKQQLKKIGIHLSIRSLESSLFFSKLAKGDFQMTLVGWVGFVDPDEWLYNLFHSEGLWNQQAYKNPKVDLLLEEARSTEPPEKRKELYQQIQSILAKDAPMVFLYINSQIAAYRKGLKNYEARPTAASKVFELVRY